MPVRVTRRAVLAAAIGLVAGVLNLPASDPPGAAAAEASSNAKASGVASHASQLAPTAGAGQYSKPEWLPLRTGSSGGELRVGCTYLSPYAPENICNDGATPYYHPYWALDLSVNQANTVVYAAGAGQVSTFPLPNSSGYGNYIVVDHGSFGRTLYAHLSSFSVANGSWVDQNSALGVVGNTGSTGGVTHLHFEYNDTSGGWGRTGTPNDPGQLKACHGSTFVTYPAAGGYSTWQGIHWGALWVHSDGTGCGDSQPPPASRASLIKGGGFESGGWSAMPSTNFVTYSAGQVAAAEVPRSGSKYAAFNTSAEGGGIYQDIPATIGVGDTYCASTFVRSQTGGMAASGGFTVWLIGGSYNENGQQAYSGLGTLNNWTPLSTCATATTAHSAVRVQFYATPGVGTTEADDISAYVTSGVHAVVSEVAPRIAGTPRVGTVLTAGGDSWYPAIVDRRYQWLANGVQIPGAARSTYVPDASVLGKLLTVRITGSKTGYAPAQTISTQVGAVLAGFIRNITSPSIAGRRKVGYTLTVRAGAWSPSDLTFRYQWIRDHKTIAGATGRKLKLRKAYRGHRISVRVTAVRSGYTTKSITTTETRRIK
jgi:hypothetical protein